MKTVLLVVTAVLVLGVTGVTYMSRSAQPGLSRAASDHLTEVRSDFEVVGRVINAAGEAVAGAQVFVESDDAGARISSDISDEDGNFSVKMRQLGDYTVYGSKEEDGYPLTVSAFHKQVRLDEIPKLHITERKTIDNVIVQLGQSAAIIEGTVKDVLTHEGVQRATITLRRADNPDLLYRTSTQAESHGKFKLVVPTDAFTMTVESPSYDVWNYGDDGTLGRAPHSVKLKRGERRRVEVGLRKSGNDNGLIER